MTWVNIPSAFFFSMLITNDVALFTFVPFAIIMLKKCNQEKLLIPVLVLQTIANIIFLAVLAVAAILL